MNWLFALQDLRNGSGSVARAIGRCLEEDYGDTVEFIETGPFGSTFRFSVPEDTDILHCFTRASIGHIDNVSQDSHNLPPFGVTLHDVQPFRWEFTARHLQAIQPRWVHVMDSFSQSFVGQLRFLCIRTRQVFDSSDWAAELLPSPPHPTIGCIGSVGVSDHDFKGMRIVEAIALAARVVAHTRPVHNWSWQAPAQVRDYYASLSVYVNAAWGACGPIPAQEALLCGRPVLTTPIDTMLEVIRPGFNGEFFDGSVRDGVRALHRILNNYEHYHQNAVNTMFNDPKEAVAGFRSRILEALE